MLQIMFLAALLFAIVKAQSLPQPVRPYAMSAQAWLIGGEVSFDAFVSTWRSRGEWVSQYLPMLGQAMSGLPNPSTITADSVLKILYTVTLEQPAKKWELIKEQFKAPVSSPSTQEPAI